jgi:serine/threonine protein phosphatase PrpC
VEPSVHTFDLAEGDIFLMCSDGLSDMLSSEEIQQIVNSKNDVKKCVKQLISTAKDRGGFDNVTVVLIKVHDFHEKKDLSR